jgi:UDP-N-acetylmuramate dehydrogenase
MDKAPFEFAVTNQPLAPLTLYGVGGAARLTLAPRTAEEAVAAYQWMQAQSGPKFVLGAGSNVLISDRGFPGIVLLTTGLDRIEQVGKDRFCIEAGVAIERLLREIMIPNNYEGVGALTGIPGSIGGAIYMNAGTTNGTTCQWVEWAEIVVGEQAKTIPIEPAFYGYRSQRFCPSGGLIVRALFRFKRSDEDQKAVCEHYLARRRERQPQGACCGSVFKNPPHDHAGRLIEACGLRGTRRGGAVISPVHANFIMNEGGATCEDILWLIDLCKRTVRACFAVELEEEVVIPRDGG